MGEPAIDIEDIAFVCDAPACPLATGGVGLTAAEIIALVRARQTPEPEAPADDDDDEPGDVADPDQAGDDEDPAADDDDAPPDDDVDEPGELDDVDPAADDPESPPAADPLGIDPLGDGAPCPLCAVADPPRAGKLLAVATGGVFQRALTATAGSLGLAVWQLVESRAKGTARMLEALEWSKSRPAPGKSKAFVIGSAVITAVVIKSLPFDGHLLRMGNRDALVRRSTKGGKFVAGTPSYGIDHGPPSAAARANPVYVRELQEDLLWLGYFSPSRGQPPVGEFDVNLLGAVLAFKRDLADSTIYGIATTPSAVSVPPGSVRAGGFASPILFQPEFVSPLKIMLDWLGMLANQNNLAGKLASIAGRLDGPLRKGSTESAFRKQLTAINETLAESEWWVEHWEHRAALEDVSAAFTPFAERKPAVAVDALALPPGPPLHADAASLLRDAAWTTAHAEFGARAENKSGFELEVKKLLAAFDRAGKATKEIAAIVASVTAPAGASAEWASTAVALALLASRVERLVSLSRFWTLNSPTQIGPWLEHLVAMGTVDQPTAVYLKALREGGRIGPHRRPAYRLFENPPDFASGDDGCAFIREECTGRTANRDRHNAGTMPESIALQFFFNESGAKFARSVAPYNTVPGDTRRLVLVGTDTNSYRRGTFDAVFHEGGRWYTSRGWGMGQETEDSGELAGIPFRHGLPIMPAGATEVRHPPSFTSVKLSFASSLERKALAKYNRRTRKSDCTFGRILDGHYYDCHACLKRFPDQGLLAPPKTAKYGQGGVIVPKAKDSFGDYRVASGFFVDLERYTKFARASGNPEDPSAVTNYNDLFGITVTPADEAVAEVLRSGPKLTASAKKVAKARGIDAKTLAAAVQNHIAERSELPCSWLLVRIQYAGSGGQAFGSLQRLFKVVAKLDAKPVLTKHIIEASELRRKGP